jgi:N-acetyl-gamma-glutamyl-phosphate/LysW-gamma-L-alpha-aminoadipyl-6-phosphate reductase
MKKVKIAIIGGAGYVSGELIRLLINHPFVESLQVVSKSQEGVRFSTVHPHLRGITDQKFISFELLDKYDFLFLALDHGTSMNEIERYQQIGERIIDLSADFRIKDSSKYLIWYHVDHPNPKYLEKFVYGLPEINRDAIAKSNHTAIPGCNATASILALYPLFKHKVVDGECIVIEAKVGSSEAGSRTSASSHHPVRNGCVRSYKPTGHRHIPEIAQMLSVDESRIHFSATSIEMVRGVLITAHLFLKSGIMEKDIWQSYRLEYSSSPFIRIIKDKKSLYQYPEPKLLAGTNFCDIGFETDMHSNRIVVIAAIDNLMKGAAGQAVQSFNIMLGVDEQTGLNFNGLHPI